MAKVIKLKDYEPKGSHHIFLDTNVLIYAFAPIANYKIEIQKQITNFFTTAKTVKTSLYVTSLVLSEYYNVLFQHDFKHWQNQSENIGKNDLKIDYRKSSEYIESIESINGGIKNILKIASPFPDDFNAIDLNNVLKLLPHADFNDCYFLEIAKQKGWTILTRDKDIINHPFRAIDVITIL